MDILIQILGIIPLFYKRCVNRGKPVLDILDLDTKYYKLKNIYLELNFLNVTCFVFH